MLGGVALSYDLLFGFTGLLSFGHALYFAVGVYVVAIATTKWDWSLPQALALTAVVGVVLPLVLGSISLRVGGIAFAMVTLAFAEAGSTLVHKNPRHLTGAEEERPVELREAAGAFVGVLNTENLYWLALATSRSSSSSPRGRSTPRRGGLAGDPRERAARPGPRPASLRFKLIVVRARLVPRDGGRGRLPAPDRQRDAAGDDAGVHALAAPDGRDRGHRDALGSGARRRAVHIPRVPPARLVRLEEAVQSLPSVLETPLSSRSSCWGRCSSCSCSSCPADRGPATRRRGAGCAVLEQSVLTEPAPAGTIDKAEAGA